MAHPVLWFEVLGQNGSQLRKFYGDLFGWTFDVLPGPDYGLVNTGDSRGIPGGVGATSPGGRQWVTFYTETPGVTASLDQVVALGGKVIMPRTEVPGATIGVFEDPEGHLMGLVESAKMAPQ